MLYVVRRKVEALLSGETSEALGIITSRDKPPNEEADDEAEAKVNLVESQDHEIEKYFKKYLNLFKGVGLHKPYEVHFHKNPLAKPVAEPPRGIPFHLREKHQKAIKQMEEDGIIEEHHVPAPWVSNVIASFLPVSIKDRDIS